jgi:uncharacterized protein YhjY with autotransporter beta-barrel domain
MRRSIGLALALYSIGGSGVVYAETNANAIARNGGSPFTVQASGAIQGTCITLRDNGGLAGQLTGSTRDLYERCREMVQSTNDVYNTTDAAGRPDPTVFTYGFEDDQDLHAAIRQFSGEEGSSQTRLATEGTNRQFAAIGARLSAIRQGLRGATSALASNGVANLGGAASADDADTGWGWFLNGNLGYGDREGTSNENEYEFDTYGYTLGIDYAFAGGLVAGVTVGYNDYEVDFDTAPSSAIAADVNGGGIESDGYAISGFLSYQVEQQYFDAIVSVGQNDYDLTRRAIFTAPNPSPGVGSIDRTFAADTESDQFSAQFTSGFVFGAGASTFDLFAGVDYLTIEVDSYTETETSGTPGGLALTFGDEDADSLQSILGASWQYALSTGVGVLSPYAGAQWRHEFDNDADVIYYQYAFALKTDTSGNPIDPATYTFGSPTDDPDEDFVNVNVGISAQFANNLLAFLQYESALLVEDTTASRVTLGLRGTF